MRFSACAALHILRTPPMVCGILNEQRLSPWPHDAIVSWVDVEKYHTPQLIHVLGFQDLKQSLMVNEKEDNCEFGGWQLQSSRECGLIFFFFFWLRYKSSSQPHFSVPCSCLVFFFKPIFCYSWRLLPPGFHLAPAVQCLLFSVKQRGLIHIFLLPDLPFWSGRFHPLISGSALTNITMSSGLGIRVECESGKKTESV